MNKKYWFSDNFILIENLNNLINLINSCFNLINLINSSFNWINLIKNSPSYQCVAQSLFY